MVHLTEPNGTKHRLHHSAIVHITDPNQHDASGIRALVGLSNGVRLSVAETPDEIERQKAQEAQAERTGLDHQTKD